MFIIDFDDTLFNTHEYKNFRLAALAKLGVSEKLYWDSYEQARINDQGESSYSNKIHAEVLETHGFDYDLVFKTLEETSKPDNLSKFVFEGASSFLARLRILGRPLVLLSLGEPNSQELKVKSVGLHDYFDRVFFVEQTKIHVLRHLFTQEPEAGAWLINDKIIESQEIKHHFSSLKIVLKESLSLTTEEYDRSGLAHYKNFDEIYEHIERSEK